MPDASGRLPWMATRRRARILLVVVFALAVFYLAYPAGLIAAPSRQRQRLPLRFEKASFDWSRAEQHHPAQAHASLPTGRPRKLSQIQHNFRQPQQEGAVLRNRRKAVVDAFTRSWASYKEHAWLHDELMPVSGSAKDPFGGWAATLVDSLDTMWIMGLKDEFYSAAAAAARIDWGNTTEAGINLFETTIRHLGGLLSSYDLSGEPALLSKATELGDMLYMAFDTPNRLPGFWLNLENAWSGAQVAGTHDPSAAPTSLSLEFTRLAQITGDNKYFDAIDRVRDFLDRTQEQSLLPGMWPAMINFQNEEVRTDNSFTLGALADSLYEYLPKMYILLGGLGEVSSSYEKMYRRAMDVVMQHLLFRPMIPDSSKDILFSGTTFVHEDGIHTVSEGQHLTCFTGGMFALGGKIFNIDEHVRVGERLARGCGWVYNSFPTGLMPEIFNLIECTNGPGATCDWDEKRWELEGDHTLSKGFRNARDPRYLLRPEAIESIFILYRITGQEDLLEMAWGMFESIMASTQTPYANSAIANVSVVGETEKEDSMESFWLSETLKYFYLIFSPPDVISLDEYVFNTEAHPFKRPG